MKSQPVLVTRNLRLLSAESEHASKRLLPLHRNLSGVHTLLGMLTMQIEHALELVAEDYLVLDVQAVELVELLKETRNRSAVAQGKVAKFANFPPSKLDVTDGGGLKN